MLMNFKQEDSLEQFAAMSRYGKLKCFLPVLRVLNFCWFFSPFFIPDSYHIGIHKYRAENSKQNTCFLDKKANSSLVLVADYN